MRRPIGLLLLLCHLALNAEAVAWTPAGIRNDCPAGASSSASSAASASPLTSIPKSFAKKGAAPSSPAARRGRRRLPLRWCRILYALSCVNPMITVVRNDHAGAPWPMVPPATERTTAAFRFIYEGVFCFLRLRPRLLFVVGACVRCLQCSTALDRLLDPPVGVGLGLNLASLSASAKWPAPFMLGWALSKPFWVFLGSEPPVGGHVPITVQLNPSLYRRSTDGKSDKDKDGGTA